MLKADQREAVLRLIREHKPVLAGPLPLVQGGTGIIHRIPIFLPKADGTERYWGLAAAVVDPMPIFRSVGLLDPTPGPNLQFALRGRDGRGAEGEVFLGDAALFQDPRSVLMDIVIPGGKWQLAARHVSPPGSLLQQLQTNLIHVLALAVAVGTGLLLAILILAHRRIRALAMVDPLTGVASRHQFNLQVERMLALAKRSKRPLTLMMLDLNGFKQVNDLHGHAAGDALLHHVAGQIRSCLRDSDLLARTGGDEFMVLLPDTPAGDHLLALFARIRSAVGTPLRHGNVELKVTPSIGAATWTDGKQSIEEVLRQADQAMYQDKLATKQA
jgi:diguanylate cyclase (GGDEF)-like protein